MEHALGIIAGSGNIPVLTAVEARERGLRVVTAALEGEASRELESLSQSLEWMNVGKLGRLISFLRREGVRQAVFAGKVHKTRLFSGALKPDLEMIKTVARLPRREDHHLLAAIARRIEQAGIRLLEQTAFLRKPFPQRGVLTKAKPTRREREDIRYGFRMAREAARLHIGQTLVVKGGSVVAVESLEGTNEAICRGGRLAGPGVVVVKVAWPQQDFRFDVPTVGLATVEACAEARARVLAIEHGRAIFLDLPQAISLADRNRLVVMCES